MEGCSTGVWHEKQRSESRHNMGPLNMSLELMIRALLILSLCQTLYASHFHVSQLIAFWKLSFCMDYIVLSLSSVVANRYCPSVSPMSVVWLHFACTDILTKQEWQEITCENNRSWQFLFFPIFFFFFIEQRGKANVDVTHKRVQWQIWYFPLDLTLSRNQPCSSRSNKHYSVSQKKSMELSLLCLIGLRRNQIERDNCVPVTFPPRQADTGGRRAHREGRWVCAHEGWCIQCSVCANMHPFWIKEAPQSPPCCCPVLNRTSGPVCPKGNNILYWGFTLLALRVQFFIKMIFWSKTAPICSHYHLNVADPSVNWPWCWTGLPSTGEQTQWLLLFCHLKIWFQSPIGKGTGSGPVLWVCVRT